MGKEAAKVDMCVCVIIYGSYRLEMHHHMAACFWLRAVCPVCPRDEVTIVEPTLVLSSRWMIEKELIHGCCC